MAAFAARLKDPVDLDSIRDDLAGAVHQALEPARISVGQPLRLTLCFSGTAANNPAGAQHPLAYGAGRHPLRASVSA